MKFQIKDKLGLAIELFAGLLTILGIGIGTTTLVGAPSLYCR